jgi:hypothetical protein
MTNEDGLLELRNKLDNIDNTLLELINQRMKVDCGYNIMGMPAVKFDEEGHPTIAWNGEK